MQRVRNRYLLLVDAVLIGATPYLLYALRYEGGAWAPGDAATALRFALAATPVTLALFYGFGLYRPLWRYASTAELQLIFLAGLSTAVTNGLLGGVVMPLIGLAAKRVPISVLVMHGIVVMGLIAAPRLLIRVRGGAGTRQRARPDGARRVLIAGAGNAGQLIIRELYSNPALGLQPIGFVDDDSFKQGHKLSGLPILGRLGDISKVVRAHNVDMLVIAMPSATGTVIRQVVRAALDAGIETRTMPGLSEILTGRVGVTSLREVEIQDLLRREPIRTDLAEVQSLCEERTVLVTGAGGSIGSELCRQIASLDPSKIVLLGHGENSIFDIMNELRATHRSLQVVPAIADVRDARRIRHVMERHRPFAVFHAAAHKHVPLMEENVCEAITNNIFGTRNVVDAALETDVAHFVLISSDKAVRPANVMGATKRVAEYVVLHAAGAHRNFVAVRFGNVLGSRGSVIPMFLQQIRQGGPVTVTHPNMRRYFMMIPEAVQLVLQAAALGRGGELFMLDMGEPVRIIDLAKDMIRLSGLEEGADIEIEFTGVRPGEKLAEELVFSHEELVSTKHPKVLRARSSESGIAAQSEIDALVRAALDGTPDAELRVALRKLVPDFAPDAAQAHSSPPSLRRPSGPRTAVREAVV